MTRVAALRTLLQRFFFTAGVTSLSRTLILRDRLLGRVRLLPFSHTPSRIRVVSANHLLDAALICPRSRAASALLICHGIGETVEHWSVAQHLLARNGIASLVFNYSGMARSSGQFSAEQCDQDALAAFQTLQSTLPGTPIDLLGFSLGSGVAVAIASRVPARSLILCQAYTSFRAAANRMGLPRGLTPLLPDVWRNESSLAALRLPILIVHGELDRLFPLSMAHALTLASQPRGTLALIPGMTHSDLHAHPREEQWKVILDHLKPAPLPASRRETVN